MNLPAQSISILHRGLLALTFGLLEILGPDKSLAWFLALMTFYAASDGVLAIAAMAQAAYAREPWAWLIIEGLAGVSGVFAIAVWPDAGVVQRAWSLAGWAIVTAIGAVLRVPRLAKRALRPWLFLAAAVVLLRFGVLGIGLAGAGHPTAGILSAACALIFAAVFFVVALRTSRPGVAARLEFHAR